MISVKLFKDEFKNIKGYTISGHANYDDYGKDIVCAGVSILATTTLNSLIYVCNINENKIDYTIEEDTGYLDVHLSSEIEGNQLVAAQIVFKTLELGIKSVIESYPGYVTLKYGEV